MLLCFRPLSFLKFAIKDVTAVFWNISAKIQYKILVKSQLHYDSLTFMFDMSLRADRQADRYIEAYIFSINNGQCFFLSIH